MRFPVDVEALAGQSVALEVKGLGKPKLIVDGRVLTSKKNVFMVEETGRQPVAIRLKGRFFDSVPNLEVEGRVLEVAPPLRVYEYAWCCLPLVLMILGGALGGALGAVASFVNVSLFRSLDPGPIRYLATACVAAASVVVFLLLGTLLAMLMG